MEKLIINICASSDSFGAYSENCEGIYAAGNTVAECKKDVYEAIRLIKENFPKERWPELIKGDYEIEWKYDVQSLLQYYQGVITNAALERLTGINRKQLWNYANGVSKPRAAAKYKIENALHNLGKELIALSL
ncbi:hypothetical protein [Bacteroides clarus]|uniref:hypothetical protein n=1 Tax=Bacteroides clarus TaxID=626929 RepID=UPI002677206A|nr:hypothetical protein [Bacteroides clarus]